MTFSPQFTFVPLSQEEVSVGVPVVELKMALGDSFATGNGLSRQIVGATGQGVWIAVMGFVSRCFSFKRLVPFCELVLNLPTLVT